MPPIQIALSRLPTLLQRGPKMRLIPSIRTSVRVSARSQVRLDTPPSVLALTRHLPTTPNPTLNRHPRLFLGPCQLPSLQRPRWHPDTRSPPLRNSQVLFHIQGPPTSFAHPLRPKCPRLYSLWGPLRVLPTGPVSQLAPKPHYLDPSPRSACLREITPPPKSTIHCPKPTNRRPEPIMYLSKSKGVHPNSLPVGRSISQVGPPQITPHLALLLSQQ